MALLFTPSLEAIHNILRVVRGEKPKYVVNLNHTK